MKDDFRDRSHLTKVDGGRQAGKPRAGRRRSLTEDEQVTCWQCAKDTGIETSVAVEVILAPRRRPDGKRSGGTKALVCGLCLARGKVTRLF
ncbi:hypothetical protein [Parvibaculum sp.]|uniref:hypothetical protein n=1 Tax=Parvibaculum sp. TaxID=2024848 RepID=UPI001DA4236D|nr:hypothetical protein [Parvibaculum sp.]MBX3490895.1 hypothetical protein [Parvibaculum sp.]